MAIALSCAVRVFFNREKESWRAIEIILKCKDSLILLDYHKKTQKKPKYGQETNLREGSSDKLQSTEIEAHFSKHFSFPIIYSDMGYIILKPYTYIQIFSIKALTHLTSWLHFNCVKQQPYIWSDGIDLFLDYFYY